MNRILFASIFFAACGGTGEPNQTSTGAVRNDTSGVASSSYAPTLVTLTGRIVSPSFAPTKSFTHVRVALVWPTATSDQEAASVDVPFSLESLPIRYVLNVTAPPPATSLQRVPADEATQDGIDASSFQFAVGNVLAYDDSNDNGRRDDDEQVIASPNTVVYYVEGGPAPAIAFPGGGNREEALPVGFSVLELQPGTPNGIGGLTPSGVVVTPISSDIDLQLDLPPDAAGLLCATGFGADATVPAETSIVQQGALPPAGAAIFCSPDGEIYAWTLCTGTICGGTCTSGDGGLATATPPASWPCTVGAP